MRMHATDDAQHYAMRAFWPTQLRKLAFKEAAAPCALSHQRLRTHASASCVAVMPWRLASATYSEVAVRARDFM